MDYVIFIGICLFIVFVGIRYLLISHKQGTLNKAWLEVGLWGFFFLVLILNAYLGWF